MGRRTPTSAEVLEHLRTHVRIDGECRVWAGTLREGYPSHQWRGRTRYVRRSLLELTGTLSLEKHVVWATCGNPHCVAEEHLRAGTRRQMMQAASRRGVFPCGTPQALKAALIRAPRARLPVTRAREAARMRAGGATWREVGRHFGVTGAAASIALKRWERSGLLNWGAL